MTEPTTQSEVMARVCYDFTWPGGCEVKGAVEIRTLSAANKVCDTLNGWHGEGSHWVEPLNWTWDERHADGEKVDKETPK